MNVIVEWGKKHPTRIVALLALAVTSAAPYLPAALALFLGGALAILIGKPLHDAVVPVAEVVEVVEEAAIETAKLISPQTAGLPGQITDEALAIARSVAHDSAG